MEGRKINFNDLMNIDSIINMFGIKKESNDIEHKISGMMKRHTVKFKNKYKKRITPNRIKNKAHKFMQ